MGSTNLKVVLSNRIVLSLIYKCTSQCTKNVGSGDINIYTCSIYPHPLWNLCTELWHLYYVTYTKGLRKQSRQYVVRTSQTDIHTRLNVNYKPQTTASSCSKQSLFTGSQIVQRPSLSLGLIQIRLLSLTGIMWDCEPRQLLSGLRLSVILNSLLCHSGVQCFSLQNVCFCIWNMVVSP